MTRAFLPKMFTVLLAGTLAGLVLAVAALPAALVFGIGFSALSAPYAELPNTLRTPPTAQRSNLYANDGTTLITSFYQEDRVDVPLDEVAPVMRQAIIAAEDARFHEHSGVDLRGIVRAFTANRRDGATRQGASTLTMQYVRNVLSTDPRLSEAQRAAATEVSTARKIQEIRYALALERELTKDQILTRYLNIAYFGAGAYGVAAASKRYFSTSPAKLTLAQAALLAGLVRSPDSDDPINGDADSATARRGYVLDRMVESGVIVADAAARAAAEPLNLRPSETPNDCTAVPEGHNDWGFFCDWFTRWWNSQKAFGASVDERQRTLRRGGFSIVSSSTPGCSGPPPNRCGGSTRPSTRTPCRPPWSSPAPAGCSPCRSTGSTAWPRTLADSRTIPTPSTNSSPVAAPSSATRQVPRSNSSPCLPLWRPDCP
ncbi:hypothetical protein GCM10029963_60170 [Micromonospora andamanensis]